MLLRSLREQACLTQEELAERSGLSIRAISDLERGRTSKPHRRSVVLLARALGIEGESLEGFRRTARRKAGPGPVGAVRSWEPAAEHRIGDRQIVERQVVDRKDAVERDRTRRLEEWMREILVQEPGPYGGSRVVELVGGPDSDTTGLAVRVASRVRGSFPDGRFYLDVAAESRGTAGLVDRLLRVLGVETPEDASSGDRLSALRSQLRSRHAVLVLDNVADAVALRPILAVGGTCAVIVIARRRLALFDGVWTVDAPATRRYATARTA
ncbi:helix-turn-helix transcriptional regulator [Allokutzneria sp. NRRL B-24872]|uniref:helix-turn-helix domain-containing protein n=1 Tax=Allokutzneria sp. NRRL B-24872 TaxID=1137961 RepID=UPI00143DF8E3|nr:helix-turn-helix transcriptional regulator [Allokutzneria sp. NRRL B-24872]